MRILTHAHRLEIGGTQTNAIDLAQYLRDAQGHDPYIFAQPGPMVRVLKERGLRYRPAPSARLPSIVGALRRAIREECPDVLHVWDSWQYVDAVFAAAAEGFGAIVVTDMISEKTPRVLPTRIRTTFGTPELAQWARRSGLHYAEYLPPPVNVTSDRRDDEQGRRCRERWGASARDFLVVIVSRLEYSMKFESLETVIEAVRRVGASAPVRLVIVGDGPARPHLESLAIDTNAFLQRSAVTLPGPMLDPRPAYSAADVVIGMGGSALRGMAHGKPVIVVGARGFASVVDHESVPHFEHVGMYGVGPKANDCEPTRRAIVRLMDDEPYATHAADSGLEFVRRAYAIDVVGNRLEQLLDEARAQPAGRTDLLFEMASVTRTRATRRLGSKARRALPLSVRSSEDYRHTRD